MIHRNIKSRGAYWFLLPYFALFSVFFFLPAVTILPMSFSKWNILGSPRWIGFANYARLFKDAFFWKAVTNTFYYTVVVTLGLTILGLLLALLLNQRIHGRTLGRMAVVMPYIVSSAAAGIVWRWMYDQNFGIINSYLHQWGFAAIPFLTDTRLSMPAIVLMNMWWSVGFNTIIYLAALQGIPEDIYEAAQVDGATAWQSLRYVTLPLLKPITLYITVLCFANSFQMFDEAYIMTQGGPVGSTVTLVFQMWNTAFSNFRFGEAASISVIILLFILTATFIQFRLSREPKESM